MLSISSGYSEFQAPKVANTKYKILIVDDEEDLLELVRYNLARDGLHVDCVTSGEDGLKLVRSSTPDLIVLDLMLPGIDGLEFCRLVRSEAKTKHIPILMLTAKGEEGDVVAGLEMGADDYIVKPFSPKVLAARVKAVLRRRERGNVADGTFDPNRAMQVKGIEIDPLRHEVKINGHLIDLTRTEFKLLQLLAGHPGWVFARAKIVDLVHGEDYPVTDRSVDVQVVGLRKKLGKLGSMIETVRGVGYRFVD